MSESIDFQAITHTKKRTVDTQTGVSSLTDREIQVLIFIGRGYSRREIGNALHISRNTAATHISSVYRKLDISSIAEATHVAIRQGLIRLM